MIQQCYNLCPEYSVDANEHARVAAGICAAVPTTSAALLPSGSNAPISQTWWPSSTTGPSSAPSASQSVTTSFGIQMSSSSTGFMCASVLIAGLLQL